MRAADVALKVGQMITVHRIDEVESLIREGRHCKARHHIRDMLADLGAHKPSDPHLAERWRVVSGLLTDTLDMLLLFYHESQISLHALQAARMLVQLPQSSRPSGAKWRRIKY